MQNICLELRLNKFSDFQTVLGVRKLNVYFIQDVKRAAIAKLLAYEERVAKTKPYLFDLPTN